MSARPRLHVSTPLAPGGAVPLDRAAAHRLRDVLRLGPGAELILFNGRDGEWAARVESLAKGGGSAVATAMLRQQVAGPNVWLCFAPVKRDAIDLIVEKAVELGVGLLQPVTTRRADVARVPLDRLAAIAAAAAQQSERLEVPVLRPPVPLDRLLADWPPGRRLLFCAESGDARPIAEAAAAAPPPAAILSGPEGGFAPEEIAAVLRLPQAVPVGLGPRILRAETAALAALAVWQAASGDWRMRPHRRI